MIAQGLQRSKLKLNSATIMVAGVPVVLSILISLTGLTGGLVALGVVGFSFVVLLIFNNFRDGFLLLIIFAFGMFHIYRMLPSSMENLPVGAGVELLLLLLFISVTLNGKKNENQIDSRCYHHPITYGFLTFILYGVVLLFHPASTSVLGRVVAVRELIAMSLAFFVALRVFQTRSYILFFTDFWIFFALLAALYGIYQEFFGLQDWELQWLYSQPDEGKLAIVWGHIRKWSFLSDINAFGLLMAYAGIVCLVMALGPFGLQKRIYLAGCGFLMLISMSFSGTRTATAMVVLGLLFFIVMTINRKSSLLVAAASVFFVFALFVGPFYGPTFNRLRSTFDVSDDPSMNVRDRTRETVQPYIRTHPFGGGANTAGRVGLLYDPGHPLAGDWDPDSGYLKTALERGWLGLLVQLGFYATVLISGLKFFYRTKDPQAAAICCAYLCGFFALSAANYAQDSLDQKPTSLILMASIVSIITLSLSEKEKTATA